MGGHVTRVGGGYRNAERGLVEKPEGKRPLKDLGVDGRIVLKQMLRNGGGEGLD
jgi:hypothetical protein